MHMLVITFGLNGISEDDYRRHCEQIAPVFTQVPGLISKVWLADPESNAYGGIYTFDGRAACDAYIGSEIVASVKSNPHFAGVTVRGFGVIDEATKITAPQRAAA